MLQANVLHTGTELREALTKGLNGVEASNAVAQQETATKVTDELKGMRNSLRDASRESINTAKSELSREVQDLLMGVRADLRGLAEAVLDRDPAAVDAPEPVPVAAAGVAVPHQRTATDAETVVPLHDEAGDDGAMREPDAGPGSDTPVDAVSTDAVTAVVREALEPFHDTVATLCTRVARSEQIAEVVGAQLSDLSAGVAAIRAQLDSAFPTQPADGASLSAEAQEEHRRLLRRAAQISHAQLVCHRDSWEFLAGQAGRHPHFRMPTQLADHGEGRVSAALSGRSLIAVLVSLEETRHATPDGDDADWAMAETAYERISAALTALEAEGETVTITLDDRTPPEGGFASEALAVEDADENNK
jgi:hypothetical protein